MNQSKVTDNQSNEYNLEPRPRFTGIFIPVEILELDLSSTEMILLSWIDALYDESKGGCWASNAYLAKTLKVEKVTIRNCLTKFRKLGLIEDVSFDGIERVIKAKINKKVDEKQDKKIAGGCAKKIAGGCAKKIAPSNKKHTYNRKKRERVKKEKEKESSSSSPLPSFLEQRASEKLDPESQAILDQVHESGIIKCGDFPPSIVFEALLKYGAKIVKATLRRLCETCSRLTLYEFNTALKAERSYASYRMNLDLNPVAC